MKIKINGKKKLEGTIFTQGAKNAILPIMTAALLPKKGQTIINNVPDIKDMHISLEIAKSIGASVSYFEKEKVLIIDPSNINKSLLDSKLTSKSRASILFLAPILHRMKKVEFNGIGGCGLGFRSLDFHHNGFKRLGATVQGEHDSITISADSLSCNTLYLDTPSQTSTENLIMGACLARGKTIIENAASEPEVVDFVSFLNKMGARINGAGTRTLIIEGVTELMPVDYTVMPDRLDAGPLMMSAIIAGGDLSVVGAQTEDMRILIEKLRQMGASINTDGQIVRVKRKGKIHPVNIISWPYPGFSTDFLPGVMAISCYSKGTSYFRENVFQDRLTQAKGLKMLGADIEKKSSNFAIVNGKNNLTGTSLEAPDLRAGMAYILAALAAEGETIIDNIYQIERGHSNIVKRLQSIGADIQYID